MPEGILSDVLVDAAVMRRRLDTIASNLGPAAAIRHLEFLYIELQQFQRSLTLRIAREAQQHQTSRPRAVKKEAL